MFKLINLDTLFFDSKYIISKAIINIIGIIKENQSLVNGAEVKYILSQISYFKIIYPKMNSKLLNIIIINKFLIMLLKYFKKYNHKKII